ncbi:MAG: hypothetical protein KGV59_07545 [Tenacibaculum sp.]|nr:hypothetical protein [Tenacibaculum sp.]
MKYNDITKEKEMNFVNDKDYKLGTFIYMGMGKCAEKTVCMSVAYKIDYCERKALEFEKATNGLAKFTHINKVKVGELSAIEKFVL